jgi:hypothetical protein
MDQFREEIEDDDFQLDIPDQDLLNQEYTSSDDEQTK